MAKLESLPIELRVQILLELPDLESLNAIACSSTALYQAYCLARQESPPKILQKNYDGLVDITEAITAVRSRKLHGTRCLDRERIIALLDDRRRNKEIRCLGKRSGTTQPLPDQPVDLNEVRELLRIHEIATWFLNDFSRNAPCPFWIDEVDWSTHVLPLKFSNNEKKRYYRAFYRLQTFCNLFGNIENPVDSADSSKSLYWDDRQPFTMEEIWKFFFGTFAPWEYEEFACLWRYCYDRNREIYAKVTNDLEQYGPIENGALPARLEVTVLPSCSLLDTDDLRSNRYNNREVLASFGPTFLHRLLREEDFTTQRNMIYANAWGGGAYFLHSVQRNYEIVYPLVYPADRFNFGMNWGGLHALLSTLPEIEQPNLSWKKTWLVRMEEGEPLYEEMFDTGVNARRWTWAYALWDNDRLWEWEAKWGAPLRDFGA
ncbi:hypothetical protein ASPSYDRAFT_40023 [Aspergillus sydowii CBS 593.65]|uniref:F-box domain-containing protein n=1 Tax=Aspergillus sydowii CBS 593.65 TaxID=1036612 RepID=A0A1L9U107_9EURO|nr:uncharacterized protein ASPSYDRAFT_40023 [Aspergillus sydowii CBS 593.65]OJJ65223.1 hypothetical protein ASPSYDRAFT_40023 [Aspergillus sydowii CBS 593.65]